MAKEAKESKTQARIEGLLTPFKQESIKIAKKTLTVIFRVWSSVKANMRAIIGNALFFSLGVSVVIWLNDMVYPNLILILSSAATIFQIMVVGLLAFMFAFFGFLIWAIFRKVKLVWFFVGASLVSLYFAGVSLYQISVLYYVNVGWALPDINIQGYSFPAIYIFKLFRSIFFTALFSVIGYWVEILRRRKS